MIKFNVPPVSGNEIVYIEDAINSGHISGDGKYTKLCSEWLEKATGTQKALLTTSCTHALEMAALLLDIQPGDEIIMPSYTFVSTANAFVLRGAEIVFVDIRPDTMNIDENKIEEAITDKTKAIIPVHYAGVACEMDTIMDIAKRYNLFVVEDAAQGIMSTYKGQTLGSIGHLGTYSFHETKNIVCGEGGALLINDKRFIERAEIIREKGTNRSQFVKGQVDKYTWRDIGSSYLMSELTAGYLYAQLENAGNIIKERVNIWNEYQELLKDVSQLELPIIPKYSGQNAHIFFIKLKDTIIRDKLMNFLKENRVQSTFHYIPLHTSEQGKRFKRNGDLLNTEKESMRLLRLPLYINLNYIDIINISNLIKRFFDNAK